MSNNQTIDFKSQDIKKKNLDFNVQDKKSVKLKTNLKNLWQQKILKSPPLKGNHKFITLPAAAIVIAAAIVLPIVLPGLLAPPPDSSSADEYDADAELEVIREAANIINNIDSDASDETKAAILSDLDSKIAVASPNSRYTLIAGKANALQKFERYDEAIDLAKSIINDLRTAKDWDALCNIADLISNIYSYKGDKASAIEWLKVAIAIIDEAANDNESPLNITGREYFERKINALEDS